eukprot:TRINITY_DN1545_c0_g1_i2.p4 TRINITY_DN1545_c0_g1~~TRINITY_DN1545_c0_g1_i2.p4  ORF type:complete len:123 (+),score=18.61 TRINITY_DN1545_c0_g1_i2:819-1187(+)
MPSPEPPAASAKTGLPPAAASEDHSVPDGELLGAPCGWGLQDGAASLPGSPFWTLDMNSADMPDGPTSVYKDHEMRRYLKAWLLPRRTTKWQKGGCTLEQKVEQKRERMHVGRVPMFMVHCG